MGKINEQVRIARQFKKRIADLAKQQDHLYGQAVRKLKVADNAQAWDWFYNDRVGLNSFEESLKDAALQT